MVYLGIDVSKANLDCTLLDPVADKHKTEVVSNDKAGLEALLAWLTKQGVSLTEAHGVMEATGVYHEQAAGGYAVSLLPKIYFVIVTLSVS